MRRKKIDHSDMKSCGDLSLDVPGQDGNTQIDSLKEDKKLLFEDPKSQEKFAREKYLMKRDNEDLFIVTPPKEEE